MIFWGQRDPIIPLAHGEEAHELIPGSSLHVFPQAGHFPHREEPVRFAMELSDFIASTDPAAVDFTRLRELATTR